TAVGYANCSLVDAPARDRADTPGFEEQCAERREAMFDLIEETQPDTLFLSASETVIDYLDMPVDAAAAEWRSGMEQTLQRLGTVENVYILTNPPRTLDPLECANRLVGPSSCESQMTEQAREKAQAEAEAASEFSNAFVI